MFSEQKVFITLEKVISIEGQECLISYSNFLITKGANVEKPGRFNCCSIKDTKPCMLNLPTI